MRRQIEKCEHGVYDPHRDAHYCTVCNPIILEETAEIETSGKFKLSKVKPMTPKERGTQTRLEKRLVKAGLGIVQPMTDNSEGELAEISMAVIHPRGKSEDHMRLRAGIDGGENFMDGHQITKVRTIEREVPEWAFSDKEVQRVLLIAFPKLRTSPRHAKKAGRWARIIYLYYRMKQPTQIVAKELALTEVALETIIRSIGRVSRGQKSDTGKPRCLPSDS